MSAFAERDLITGYSPDPKQPVLFARRSLLSLAPGEQLNYDLSSVQYCVGFDDPLGAMGACPEQAEAVTGSQCEGCMVKTRRQACLACTGRTCINRARYASCVPADHHVYLACYDVPLVDAETDRRMNRPFKVGVTRAERFERRIVEQGAWAAIGIASAGGQEVRRIEHQIMKAGWPDRLNVLSLLARPRVQPRDAELLLRDEVRRISKRLPDLPLVDDGRFTWAGDHFPAELALPPRTLDPRQDALAGTVIGLRGGYLLLDVASEHVAVALRGLTGRELSPRSAEVLGPAQGAFAF